MVPSQLDLAAAGFGAGGGAAVTGFDWTGGGTISGSGGAGSADHGISAFGAVSVDVGGPDTLVLSPWSTAADSGSTTGGAGSADHGILMAGAGPDRCADSGSPEPAVEGSGRVGVQGWYGVGRDPGFAGSLASYGSGSATSSTLGMTISTPELS
jgi:hypothetical protein